MFAFCRADNVLNLNFDDQVLWHHITVSVCLEDGQEVTLPPTGQPNEFILDDQVSVRFSLVSSGQKLALSVSASILKGISWPGLCWHPLRAITLRIESLGFLSGLCGHYLYNSWWTRPCFDRTLSELPGHTQSLLWENGDNYRHMMAFCDAEVMGEISGAEKEGLKVVVSPQKAGVRHFSGTFLLMGFGDDPYELINQNVAFGRKQLSFSSLPREERKLPEMFDYLGWCSWDACYLDVDELKIVAKAEEFQEKNIPVKWMLVDDGWSEEKGRKLLSLHEDESKFPGGFKGLKDKLVHDYDIPWLGAWQALTGHWEGIDWSACVESVVDELDGLRCLPPTEFENACLFWFGWHDYLARQGVDFIKVDVQSNLGQHYRYREHPGEIAISVHRALEASASLHFGGRLINCMGMALPQLWNRPSSSLSRNSDDFFPRQENNIREFALQNAYNALFHDAFCQGDWDMWWSQHPDAEAHAMLRAVSGGPIYTSDPVGDTDAELVSKLVFNDGRVVRCDYQGKVVRKELFDDPLSSGRLLKIWNYIGDVAVLLLLNISEEPITERPSHLLVEGVSGDDWLVYRPRFEGHFEAGMMPEITLATDQAELLLFYPEDDLFCLGLADKLLPSAAIVDQFVTYGEGLRTLYISLKQGGNLVISSQTPIRKVVVNAQVYPFKQEGELFWVDCSEWADGVRVEVIAEG